MRNLYSILEKNLLLKMSPNKGSSFFFSVIRDENKSYSEEEL